MGSTALGIVVVLATAAAAHAQAAPPSATPPASRPARPPKPVAPQTASPAARSIADIEQAITRTPRDPALHVALGLARWDRGDAAGALAAFERAVAVGPTSADAYNWLGGALMEKADLPGAIAALRRAVALEPKNGRAHTNLGAALVKSGDYPQAVTVFRTALTLEPNSRAAHMNLGMALREAGDLDEALTHLRLVAKAEPDDAGVQHELGQTLRQAGDLAGAIAAFEQAVALDPELREAYYGLGQALRQQAAALRKPEADAPTPVASATEAADQLKQGITLGQQGQLEAALPHLERAVTLAPGSAEAHYHLGAAQWYAGRHAEALTHLRRSAALDPASGVTQAFLGTALRDDGETAGARAALQRAIALLPPTASVFVDLGILFARGGEIDHALGQFDAGLTLPAASQPAPDWKGAAEALRAAIARTPGRGDAYDTLGLLLGRQGADRAEVLAAFRDAIRVQPDLAAAHNHLGLSLIQVGQDAEGIAALREAVRLAPDFAEAHANLGAALTPTDAASAVAELETAVRLAPTYANARFNLAEAYGASQAHGPQRQIAELRSLLEQQPDFVRARVALGKALLQSGDVAGAVEALQAAVTADAENGEAQYQLGLALARAGRKDEATAALQKGRALVAASDRDQRLALDLAEGRAALNRGERDRAVDRFQRALKLDPGSIEARRELHAARADSPALARGAGPSSIDDGAKVATIEGLIREARFADAEPQLVDYVAVHPQSSWGWYALGYSRFAQQKIGEAIKALAKSLELDLTNAEAHKILGRTLMIIGRFDAARVEFEQGLRYKPDSAELHYNLGKLHSIQDNWPAAKTALEAAVKADPDYVEAIEALGFALEALGDDAGAVARYEQAVALNAARNGTFANAHVSLAAFYNRTDRPEKALEYAKEAIALDPKSDRGYFQKARADERQGRNEDAVVALNQAIALNPRASSYYYVLAGVYRRLGWTTDSQEALASFKRLEQESRDLDEQRRKQGLAPAAPARSQDDRPPLEQKPRD
jgi:tetratricopeptide (TPR) repeat protein